MTHITLLAKEGKGRTLDRTAELCEAIKNVCYEVGEGMPLAAVIGCLDIAKMEIVRDQ